MPPNPMLNQLSSWETHKIITATDLGFAEFIDRLYPGEAPEVLLAAALTSRQYGLGHTCFDPQDFLADPESFLSLQIPEDASTTLIKATSGIKDLATTVKLDRWLERLHHAKAISQSGEGRPLILDGDQLYLARNWRYEQQVARAIQSRLGYISAPFEDQVFLNALFGTQDENAPGPNMQKIACALSTRAKLLILTGGPGTGKTYTVVRLLALLLHRQEKLRILLAAPTGKAAARLTESIRDSLNADEIKALPESLRAGIPSKATTLHQMLRSKKNSRSFHHDETNPLHADVVIVDEASMIDLEMMANLMKAVPPQALLILVGDKDQLSSVEAGYVLGDLCRELSSVTAGEFRRDLKSDADQRGYSSDTIEWIKDATGECIQDERCVKTDRLAQQTVMLEHSKRFAGDSGIGKLAEAVNQSQVEVAIEILKGNPRFDDIHWIEKNRPDKKLIDALCMGGETDRDIPEFEGYSEYLKKVKASEDVPTDLEGQNQYFEEILDAFGTFQVLCAVRQGPWGVESLNKIILSQLQKKRLITTYGLADPEWYNGRPVMATHNDYELGIMNGDVGITLAFRNEQTGDSVLRVVFKDPEGTKRPYKVVLPSRLTDVETVFAMTVHKSQGSEFGHVALMLPDPEKAVVLSKELLYTGITRAKKKLTVIGGDAEQFREIINRKTQRSGRLGNLLT